MNAKNWKQRALAVILIIIMAFGGVNIPLHKVYASNEIDFGGGVRGVLEERTLTVSKTDPNGSGKMNDFDENESPVAGEIVNKLLIEDGVELIGEHAFENISLESVTIAESVYGIGNYAFNNNDLTSVIIPEGVGIIGKHAFHENGLKSVKIPGSVKVIEEESFSENTSLESIIISEGVEVIGEKAFADCLWEVKSLTIPESVYKIDSAAFMDNYSIAKITIGSGVNVADDKVEYGATEGTTGKNIGFKKVYDDGGKKAGTYIYENNAWEKVAAYKVNYNYNAGGNTSSHTEYFIDGETVKMLGNIGGLTKVGYVFTGWNTEADGRGTFYGKNDSFEMGTEDITLYPNWSKSAFSGDGSAEKPYEINTPEDLELLSEKVNTENDIYADKNYRLMDDIDLGGRQWIPIGSKEFISGSWVKIPFTGVFDGNDKRIDNLSINIQEGSEENFAKMGLFGYISGATVKDLQLKVDIYTDKSIYNNKIGALVGSIDGWKNKTYISNVSVEGAIEVSHDEYDASVGGLAGYVNDVRISNSKSTVDIKATEGQLGGFIGWFREGLVDNCQASGKINSINDNVNIGGFVGLNEATIVNSSASGKVVSTGMNSNVGGFAGINEGSAFTIKNSYATGDVTGGNNSAIGGFVGENTKLVINCYASGNVDGGTDASIGGFAGENIGRWGDKGELVYIYNNKDIMETAVGLNKNENRNEEGIILNSFVLTEAQMKAQSGQEGSLVDILNNNRENKERYYWNRVNEMIESNGGELIEWSEWENFKESRGIPENEWNYWTVSADENNGFPVFGKPVVYTLTFDSNGGGAVSQQSVNEGDRALLPKSPVKDGSLFVGWYKDMQLRDKWDFKTDIVNEDMTLYAKWQQFEGEGTFKMPYEIYTREDLELLTMVVNEGYEEYIDKHYKLMNDIDLGDEAWTPIGKLGRIIDGMDIKAFKGVFDGNNKEITNLFVGTKENYNTETNIIGLFGVIDGATIKDLNLKVSVYLNDTGGSRYPKAVGGLVAGILGEAKSYIDNVKVGGSIDVKEDSIDIKSRESGGFPVFVGGLAAGVENAEIKDSKSMVDINSAKGNVGGFVGMITPMTKIDDCHANGNIISTAERAIVGGFIGINQGTILNSFATGDVSATGIYSKAGGFAGINEGSGDTIINSYATGNIIGGNNAVIGGFVGENSKLIINSYASGSSEAGRDSHVGGFAGTNVGRYGNSGKLNCTYNNKNITTISIGNAENLGMVENSLPVAEAQMKAATGQEGALMDILNTNRKLENQQNEWNEWAVDPEMNEGFPTFKKMLPKEYAVTFDSRGGSEIDVQKVMEEEKVAKPENPSMEEHIFKGWYKDEELTSEWKFDSDIVTDNITLYAKWERISSGGSSGGGSSSKPSNPESPVIVIVNGKEENAGKETRKEENGKKVIEVVAKPEVMKAKIEEALKNKKEGEENFVEVPVSDTTADITRVALSGEIVKKMENHDFTFSVDKKNIQYNIPAKEFAIESVAKKLEVNAKQLSEIEVELQISKVADETTKKYEKIAKERANEIVVAPIEFNIEAKVKTTDGSMEKTKISRFNSYVERVIEIPEGIDPSKITTGIVFNEDGSYSHVPTEVFEKKGKYYAKLNSLTNSTYSVIWNPVTVDAVKTHWSKAAVNDMASRLVVSDVEEFVPDKAINRAEFANYIVRALGLYREEFEFSKEQKMFLDVEKSHPSFTGISIASELGIVNGYPDGTFRPDNKISREEAMKMYAKAMDIVKLVQVDENRISSYEDRGKVAPWAYEAVRKTLGAGVFNGREEDRIAPKGTLTCAEAATAIRNLLIESGLINE